MISLIQRMFAFPGNTTSFSLIHHILNTKDVRFSGSDRFLVCKGDRWLHLGLKFCDFGSRDSDLFGYILHRGFRSPQLMRFSQNRNLGVHEIGVHEILECTDLTNSALVLELECMTL